MGGKIFIGGTKLQQGLQRGPNNNKSLQSNKPSTKKVNFQFGIE